MASGVAPSKATNWLRTTLALYGAVALDNPVALDDVGSSSAVRPNRHQGQPAIGEHGAILSAPETLDETTATDTPPATLVLSARQAAARGCSTETAMASSAPT
jgi:hypothetical protein